MKPECTFYNDGACIRLHNRRILIKKDEKDYLIEFTNIIPGRKWKTVKIKRIKGKKVVTALRLSEEAMYYLAMTFTVFDLPEDERQKFFNQLQ